jgi:hypothetical protein
MKKDKRLGAGKRAWKTRRKNQLAKAAKPTAKKPTVKKPTAKKPVAKKPVAKKPAISKKSAKITKASKNAVKSNSQYDVVLNHLVKHGSINTIEAIKSYNVLRLGAVIFNLRQGGMVIKTGVHVFTNKNGRKSNIAKYVLQA